MPSFRNQTESRDSPPAPIEPKGEPLSERIASGRPTSLTLLTARGVGVVNSAVFNAGFLVGGPYYDYRKVTQEDEPELFAWRERFFAVCAEHGVAPAVACVQFALSPPGVAAAGDHESAEILI